MDFEKWIAKQEEQEKKGKRLYLHFDPYISVVKNVKKLKPFLQSPSKISSHSFYPLIRSDSNTPRYKKTDEKDINDKVKRVIEVKTRQIYYAAHLDAIIYSYYSSVLTDLYEDVIRKLGICECVTAYLEKDKKNNIHFGNEVFEFVKSKGVCVALAFDIRSFFDGLDHQHLNEMWCKVLGVNVLPIDHRKIFNSVTQFSFVQKEILKEIFPESFYGRNVDRRICSPKQFRDFVRGSKSIVKNEFKNKVPSSTNYGKMCGVPQGTPISACLSNIYMIDFDCAISKCLQSIGGLYRRYSDDIIVVVPREKMHDIKSTIEREILKFHLELNESKTDVVFFRVDQNGKLRGYENENVEINKTQNLQYLGFDFNGVDVFVRSSSYSKYYKRLISEVKKNVKVAKGKKSKVKKIFRKKIYKKFTDKGDHNFISYTKKASHIMNSNSIKRQYRPNLNKVKKIINLIEAPANKTSTQD